MKILKTIPKYRETHPYGMCYYSKNIYKHNIKCVYINIPKNASTWTKNFLIKHYGWDTIDDYNNKRLLGTKKIVILRDPIDRWISGLHHYFFLNKITPSWSKDFLDLCFNVLLFDEHTDHQVNYLNNLRTKDCIFFYVNESLKNNIRHFCDKQGWVKNSVNFNDIEYKNTNHINKENVKKLKSLIENNPKYKEKLENFYKNDYSLIRAVKFYAPNQSI